MTTSLGAPGRDARFERGDDLLRPFDGQIRDQDARFEDASGRLTVGTQVRRKVAAIPADAVDVLMRGLGAVGVLHHDDAVWTHRVQDLTQHLGEGGIADAVQRHPGDLVRVVDPPGLRIEGVEGDERGRLVAPGIARPRPRHRRSDARPRAGAPGPGRRSSRHHPRRSRRRAGSGRGSSSRRRSRRGPQARWCGGRSSRRYRALRARRADDRRDGDGPRHRPEGGCDECRHLTGAAQQRRARRRPVEDRRVLRGSGGTVDGQVAS